MSQVQRVHIHMGPDPMDEGLPHDMDGVTAAVHLQQENVNLKTRLAQIEKEMEQRKINSILRTWMSGSTSSSPLLPADLICQLRLDIHPIRSD